MSSFKSSLIDGGEILTLKERGEYMSDSEKASLRLARKIEIGAPGRPAIAVVDAANRSVEIMEKGNDVMFSAEMAQSRAMILGMAGQRDESLAEIQRLLAHPLGYSRWSLYLDPQWDFFRDDERFNELARPLNLKEAQQ